MQGTGPSWWCSPTSPAWYVRRRRPKCRPRPDDASQGFPHAGAMTSTPVVSVEGLTKYYGPRAAVGHLTVELPRGVVAGFIGPNGAGKTTTMAMLLGLVRPTSGRGTVLGEPLEIGRAHV